MIFAVLKFILRIILVLLLILLVLLTVLLLMRLKYSVSGKYDEDVEFGFKLSILFGLVKVGFATAGKNEGLRFSIFGFGNMTKAALKETNAEAPESLLAEEPEITSEKLEISEKEPPEKTSEKPKPAKIKEEVNPEKKKEEKKADVKNTAEKFDDSDDYLFSDDFDEEYEPPPKKKTNKKKKKDKKHAEEPKGIFGKLKQGYDRFNEFREKHDIPLLIKLAFAYLIDQVKSLGIRGGSVSGELGLDDPSKTGMALGGIGAAGAFVPVDINIEGNFEKKVIAAEGEIYGKTYLLKLLLPIIKFIFKKPVWALIKDIFL